MTGCILKFLRLMLLFAVCCSAAEAKRVKLNVGDPAPTWTALPATDGKSYGSNDFEKSKLIAVVFMGNECPVAQSCEASLSALSKRLKEMHVSVVAINSNKGEDIGEMREYAAKKKLMYFYLRDEKQNVAKRFGALRTPEVFLLDEARNVVYAGAINDDVRMTGKPKHEYLREAIEAVLAGKKIANPTTRAVGCTIRWK